MSRFYFLVLSCFLLNACSSEAQESTRTLDEGRILFYNVENLFDAEDDPSTDDSQFLPAYEARPWTNERYLEKLGKIAEVLNAALKDREVLAIGLCEVENLQVLHQLQALLDNGDDYRVLHQDSPDERGIDVALLYNSNHLELTGHEFMEVFYKFDQGDQTRDALYAETRLKSGEKLHLFVNHWPSRRSGPEKRIHVGGMLRAKINEITAADPGANILVMGDLNDEWHDESVQDALGANGEHETLVEGQLVNLLAPAARNGRGTINYRCKWQVFDHMIVSQSLMDDASLECKGKTAGIFAEEWMTYHSGSCQDDLPSKYSGGNKFYGGYSDHFPVYVDLELR